MEHIGDNDDNDDNIVLKEDTFSESFNTLANDIKEDRDMTEVQARAGRMSMIASETVNNHNMQVFEPSLVAVEQYYGDEAVQEVRNDLARIDDINNHTIGSIEASGGAISEEATRAIKVLKNNKISVKNLTESEVVRVKGFINNETEEYEDMKVNYVDDAFSRGINGIHSRRDGKEPAFWDEDLQRKIEDWQDKFSRWRDEGKDPEAKFDANQAYDEYREYEGDNISVWRRLHEQDMDLYEDLLDGGSITDSSKYAIGYFTHKDIEDIDVFDKSKWVDILGYQYKLTTDRNNTSTSLSALIDATIPSNTTDVEEELSYAFIAEEILQNRRLGPKNMLTVSSSLALKVLEMEEPKSSEMKKIHNEAMRSMGWLTKYIGLFLGYSKEELRQRFGGGKNERPVNVDFYREIVNTVKGMSDDRSDYLSKGEKRILTKMDEHMHKLINYVSALEKQEDANSIFSEELD